MVDRDAGQAGAGGPRWAEPEPLHRVDQARAFKQVAHRGAPRRRVQVAAHHRQPILLRDPCGNRLQLHVALCRDVRRHRRQGMNAKQSQRSTVPCDARLDRGHIDDAMSDVDRAGGLDGEVLFRFLSDKHGDAEVVRARMQSNRAITDRVANDHFHPVWIDFLQQNEVCFTFDDVLNGLVVLLIGRQQIESEQMQRRSVGRLNAWADIKRGDAGEIDEHRDETDESQRTPTHQHGEYRRDAHQDDILSAKVTGQVQQPTVLAQETDACGDECWEGEQRDDCPTDTMCFAWVLGRLVRTDTVRLAGCGMSCYRRGHVAMVWATLATMLIAVCVYCSSRDVVDPAFFTVAQAMGRAIAQRAGTLVYGGGSVGLMGAVARAVHAHGGKVVGVIPESMVQHELAYHDADELIVTDTMRERKRLMEERADAFVTLPGGFGTLEELFEILTHRHLGYHNKPIVVLNSDGFYNPLIELLEHLYEHQFARESTRGTYHIVDNVDAVFTAIESELG